MILERVSHPFTTRADWLSLRANYLTSTEVGALFGLSPWISFYELWHRHKKNLADDFTENERTIWGQRLQDAVGEGVAADQDWVARKKEEFITMPALRLGSSFDWEVISPATSKALLEIKNVDYFQFREGWTETEDGNLEAPLHIEIQVQHQMLVSGADKCYIAALVGGNKVVLLTRVVDLGVVSSIISKSSIFWKSIDDNIEPAPDFKAGDAEIIARLYQYAEPNKVFDARENQTVTELATRDRKVKLLMDRLKLVREECKAKILMEINDAEKVVGNGFSISAGMIAPTRVEAFEKKGFRMFTPYWSKKK